MTSIAVTKRVVLAKGQAMLETGIAIGLPEETYPRLAARTGMAIKMGIAVGSGVIDADYTGEVKGILADHGQAEYSFSAGDRIAQLIVQKIADADTMEVDDLGITERGQIGVGSSDLNHQPSITAKEEGITICSLQAETNNNKLFSAPDISHHTRLMRQRKLLSSARVNAPVIQTMNESFLDKIRVAGKEDERWQARGLELVRLRESGKEMRNEWIEKDRLLYYKNRL